jgi:hypothetical protein
LGACYAERNGFSIEQAAVLTNARNKLRRDRLRTSKHTTKRGARRGRKVVAAVAHVWNKEQSVRAKIRLVIHVARNFGRAGRAFRPRYAKRNSLGVDELAVFADAGNKLRRRRLRASEHATESIILCGRENVEGAARATNDGPANAVPLIGSAIAGVILLTDIRICRKV